MREIKSQLKALIDSVENMEENAEGMLLGGFAFIGGGDTVPIGQRKLQLRLLLRSKQRQLQLSLFRQHDLQTDQQGSKRRRLHRVPLLKMLLPRASYRGALGSGFYFLVA